MAHVKQVAHLTKQRNEVGQSLSQGTLSSAWVVGQGCCYSDWGYRHATQMGVTCSGCWCQGTCHGPVLPRLSPRQNGPFARNFLTGQWSLTSKSPWYR